MAFHFSYQIRVRYSEIDGQKIVFNAHYLTYLDIAFTEYVRGLLGDEWVKNPRTYRFDPVLVKSTVEYKQPALLDDLLSILVRVKKIGNSSLTVESLIKRDGEVIVEAETIQVNFDPESRTAVSLPSDLINRIREFEGTNV